LCVPWSGALPRGPGRLSVRTSNVVGAIEKHNAPPYPSSALGFIGLANISQSIKTPWSYGKVGIRLLTRSFNEEDRRVVEYTSLCKARGPRNAPCPCSRVGMARSHRPDAQVPGLWVAVHMSFNLRVMMFMQPAILTKDRAATRSADSRRIQGLECTQEQSRKVHAPLASRGDSNVDGSASAKALRVRRRDGENLGSAEATAWYPSFFRVGSRGGQAAVSQVCCANVRGFEGVAKNPMSGHGCSGGVVLHMIR
jgi:hypothetical protein